jgi:HEAT repeat protein
MEAKTWSRGFRWYQVSVVRLMVFVAVVAVLWSAWLYHREHADIERSWVSIHLRDLLDDDAVQRRGAAENLDQVEADDAARVVSGLACAVGDPDWQVRRAAAHSLANVIQRCAANSKEKLIDEIDLAMRALIPALDDTSTEVRLANVIQRCAANSKEKLIDEIDLAMRALIPALDDTSTEVRIAAMRSVGRLGAICPSPRGGPGRSATTGVVMPQAKQAAAALLEAMHDPATHIRAEAIRSLGFIGPSAGIDFGPIKEAAENDPTIEVRNAAIGALTTGWLEELHNQDVLSR